MLELARTLFFFSLRKFFSSAGSFNLVIKCSRAAIAQPHFPETRPCCVCCSQHCWCALPALPSRDLTEASSQAALRFGMSSTASFMGWLHVSVLGGTSFLCLDLQPEAVPACLVLAMAGHWDVVGAQCLQPALCWPQGCSWQIAGCTARLLCLALMETGPGHSSWCSSTVSGTWLIWSWAKHVWCLHVLQGHAEWQECSCPWPFFTWKPGNFHGGTTQSCSPSLPLIAALWCKFPAGSATGIGKCALCEWLSKCFKMVVPVTYILLRHLELCSIEILIFSWFCWRNWWSWWPCQECVSSTLYFQ